MGATPAPEVVAIVEFRSPEDDGQDGIVDVAIRNNGTTTVYEIRVSAIARDPGGQIIASGESYRHAFPVAIRPGNYGYASVGFEATTSLPSDVAYEFTLSWKEESPEIDLMPEEWNVLDNSVVGVLRDPTDFEAKFPTLSVSCFADDRLIDVRGGALPGVAGDSAPPGGQIGFTFILGDSPCHDFLVAGRALR